MNEINNDEIESVLRTYGWAVLHNGWIVPPPTAISHKTTFEPDGIVGAELSELFLNDFIPVRLDSGILQICGIYPGVPDQTALISYMLSVSGYSKMRLPPIQLQFANEYTALTAAISWCLACGWKFIFIAEGHRYAFAGGTSETITVSWDETQPLRQNVDELLVNLEFKKQTL